ncbi:MAG: hypothetical protein JXB62_06425 [Pirellulales bacterium]|nr:hypothetical protein [Pirellulales bacterium]
MLRYLVCVAVVLGISLSALAAEESALPLVFEDDFEKGADHWQPTDRGAWRIVETDRGKVYNQFKLSDYQPPHRSPYNISLVKDVVVGDLMMKVKLQSTNKDAGAHRDMCLFFNYRDPAHFYYVHLGARPDPHSSQIMIVNDDARKMITTNKSPGIPWTDGWHEVKIVRRVQDGAIEIYFDDMKKPVMVAKDKTFTSGQVGIGSFDDHGNWDDFKLYGKKVEKE